MVDGMVAGRRQGEGEGGTSWPKNPGLIGASTSPAHSLDSRALGADS